MINTKSLLSRALRVVDAISWSERGLRFSEVSAILDNPSPSTVNKILKELSGAAVVRKTSQGRYALGSKPYFWGRVAIARNTPMQIIRQQMRRIHETYRVSVNLFTRNDETMICLECYLDAKTPPLYPAGKCLPLELGVQGAVFFIPPETLDDPDFLEQEAQNYAVPIAVDDLRWMIRQTRLTDLQDDGAIFYPGLRRFCVPIREQNKIVMTVGVGVSAKRIADGQLSELIISELRDVRRKVEDCFA